MPSRGELGAVLGRGWVVASVAVTAAVVGVWAAAVPRPVPVFGAPRPSRSVVQRGYDDPALAPRSEFDAQRYLGPRREGSVLDAILGWGAVALVVAGVLVVLFVLVRHLLANREARSLPEDDAAGPDLTGLAAAVAVDAEGRIAALSTGTPAEGIVAAWTRLEAVLRTEGLPLPESRTSTETTVSALGRYVVDAEALHRLAELYREASWSRHPMTEDDRTEAEAALRALDAQLAAVRPARVAHG